MSKVDADARLGVVAEASHEGEPRARADDPNVKFAQNEDHPAQSEDRRETEDLLAGFDRPGRSAKVPARERDFVGYYAKKKGDTADSGAETKSARARANAAQAEEYTLLRTETDEDEGEEATLVKSRKRDGAPVWLVWLAAALFMLVVGGGIAYWATGETTPGSQAQVGPNAASTVTAATTKPQAVNGIVPPPDASTATTPTTSPTAKSSVPAVPSNAETPPRASAGRRSPRVPSSGAAPSGAGSSAQSATNASRPPPPPRDDFIRDL